LKQVFDFAESIVQPVFLVGGPVRDTILGRSVNDWDFTTPVTPDWIEAGVRAIGRKPYTTGARFGTIGARLDGELIEITTHRSETYTAGSRKPEVTFSDSLLDDLSRRDFTINAIAQDSNGFRYDPFKGEQDLDNGVLRCVGEASDRLRDDPLRMLRAVRFLSQLELKADEELFSTTRYQAAEILNVSRERWLVELEKTLVGPHVSMALWFLYDTGLLKFVLPDLSLQTSYQWLSTVNRVMDSPNEIDARWAALFSQITLPYQIGLGDRLLALELVGRIALQLKWSTYRTKSVKAIMEADY